MIAARVLAFILVLITGLSWAMPRPAEASNQPGESLHTGSDSLEDLRDDLITRLESQTLNSEYDTAPIETLKAFLRGLESIDAEAGSDEQHVLRAFRKYTNSRITLEDASRKSYDDAIQRLNAALSNGGDAATLEELSTIMNSALEQNLALRMFWLLGLKEYESDLLKNGLRRSAAAAMVTDRLRYHAELCRMRAEVEAHRLCRLIAIVESPKSDGEAADLKSRLAASIAENQAFTGPLDGLRSQLTQHHLESLANRKTIDRPASLRGVKLREAIVGPWYSSAYVTVPFDLEKDEFNPVMLKEFTTLAPGASRLLMYANSFGVTIYSAPETGIETTFHVTEFVIVSGNTPHASIRLFRSSKESYSATARGLTVQSKNRPVAAACSDTLTREFREMAPNFSTGMIGMVNGSMSTGEPETSRIAAVSDDVLSVRFSEEPSNTEEYSWTMVRVNLSK